MSRGSRRGFSLIEALVAVVVAGIGITAALGGMRALAKAERDTTRTETMQRLAMEKFDEVVPTGEIDTAPLEGNFEDRGVDGYRWRAEVEQSGIENLEIVTVTVEPAEQPDEFEALITGLRFVAPAPAEGDGQ